MQLLVIDIARSSHNNILPHIVVCMVVADHLPRDGLHVVQVPQYWQAHLMVLEDAAVSNLDRSFKGLGLLGFKQFAVDGAALIFDVLLTIQRVGDHVADNLN